MSRCSDLLEKFESLEKFEAYSSDGRVQPKTKLVFYPNSIDYDDEELLKALKSVGINPDKAYATDNIPTGPGRITPSRVLPKIAISSKGLPDVDGADLTYFKLPSAKVMLIDYGPETYLISDKKDIPELTKAYKDFEAYR